MKCEVCKTKEAKHNSIVCSDNCNEIRLMIIKLVDKYTPTNGCDNCWGDLHTGCSGQCQNEFKAATIFNQELWKIARTIMKNN